MIDLVNLQQKVKVDLAPYRSFVKTLRSTVPDVTNRKFTVAIIDDDRMRQLNQMFRGKDLTTDVLSFPHQPDDFDPDKANLGDIVISIEQARKQARENGLTLDVEIKQLILHGLLHLCGYDHETDDGEMDAIEIKNRHALAIQ